jgi:hypothetical protein
MQWYVFKWVCVSSICEYAKLVCKFVCEAIVPFLLSIPASTFIWSMGVLWMRFDHYPFTLGIIQCSLHISGNMTTNTLWHIKMR